MIVDQEKRQKRMARVDAMPADLRACVHEYGLTIVDAFLAAGVKNPRHIRHCVKMIRDGSYQGKRDGAMPVGAAP